MEVNELTNWLLKINKMTPIEFEGVTIFVDYLYTPEEHAVNYFPDGSGHPGSPASVEIEEIFCFEELSKLFDISCISSMYELLENKIIEYEEARQYSGRTDF